MVRSDQAKGGRFSRYQVNWQMGEDLVKLTSVSRAISFRVSDNLSSPYFERISLMQVREWIDNNATAVTLGAVVIMFCAFGIVICQLRGGGGARGTQITHQYFYDLNTGELFEAEIQKHPPIDAPSGALQRAMPPLRQGGPAGVRARVFSCTDCSDRSSHFIGYLEMFPPQVKHRLEEAGDQAGLMMEMEAMQVLIRREDGDRWISSDRTEYGQIMREVYSRDRCPDGQRPRPCHPR